MKSLFRRLVFAIGLGRIYRALASLKARTRVLCNRLRVRACYQRTLRRINHYPRNQKIRVLFLVETAAKWKAQSLFSAMKADGRFLPVMAVCTEKITPFWTAEKAIAKMDGDRAFYESLGNQCVEAFDRHSMKAIDLRTFKPDIVFFQEPWRFFEVLSVPYVSKFALCCYIPYSIETFELHISHRLPYFHEQLFLQVAPTAVDAEYIKSWIPWWRRSGSIAGLGHTIFDEYRRTINSQGKNPRDIVIYAPHFSFPAEGVKRAFTMSTFLETGKAILEYALQHPEIKWLFKPHPRLRRELEETGVWTRSEIDDYYLAWERIGEVCDTGDYIRLFMQSKALITDCSSFLVEYPVTGNPLIRLVGESVSAKVRPAYDNLFSTFYTVKSLEELKTVFATVLERGEDPMRKERLKAVDSLGVMGEKSSTERIMGALLGICGKKGIRK